MNTTNRALALLLAIFLPGLPLAAQGAGGTLRATSNTPPVAGFGHALDFDGSNEYVEVPHAAALNPDSFTVEGWVQTRQSGLFNGERGSASGEPVDIGLGRATGLHKLQKVGAGQTLAAGEV